VRIGIIKNNFFPSGGGSERYTNGLVSQLLARGYEVRVVAARWDPAAASSGVRLQRVPIMPGPSFVRTLSFALNCRRVVERSDCDCVLSIERTIRQDIFRAGGGCHREWLIQRRRYRAGAGQNLFWLNPLHLALLWIEKQSYSAQNTRSIIANSHRGKAEIIRHYHFPADRIHVIHNGTDCERFKPAVQRTNQNETVLVFAGSGFERKGLEFAIRALAQLPATVRLEVAGKGNPSRYQRIAKRLGVADRLRFLGSTARMEETYARSDILVHPAIYEPFSNTCLEALACGLPVVTSRINGASEIVRPGENGRVVEDPSDIPALAAAIEFFLDPAVRARARMAARQTAEALPMSLNVEKTLAVMDGLQTQPRFAARM
jgi:UDP-glucose:(heptosyl)LPS alpha-1,3-glucosyltransferase